MNGLEIPWRDLSPEALQGLIEAYVMRDGTDYGEQEVALAEKVEQIRRQVRSGQVRVVFDTASESVTLVTAEAWLAAKR